MASARKLAGLVGAEPTDEQAGQLAAALHQSLGQGYGVAAAALAAAGVPPLTAGRHRDGGFLLVDEAANSLFFTPPPQAYPVESHLRGVVGHLAFGATLGPCWPWPGACASSSAPAAPGAGRRGRRRRGPRRRGPWGRRAAPGRRGAA